MRKEFLFKLNIQLFGATVSDQVKQDKYSTHIKVAYGQATTEEKNRLLSYYQKNMSGNHDRFAFYTSGTLEARENDETVTDNGTDTTVKLKKGASVKDFFGSVYVTPTRQELPFYRDEDDDDVTALEMEGSLIRAQVSGMVKKTISKMLAPLKTLSNDTKGSRTIQVMTKTGTKTLTLPTSNEFGDKSKSFKDNEEAFFDMLSEMEAMSVGNGLNADICLLVGKKGNAMFKQYDRASYGEYITTEDFKMKNGQKLAIKKFDVAEIVPLQQYDSEIGVNYIIGLLTDAMGYDSIGEPKAVRKVLEETGSIFYNLKEKNQATVVDEKGIFIFDYNGKYKTTP